MINAEVLQNAHFSANGRWWMILTGKATGV